MRLVLMFAIMLALSTVAHAQSDPAALDRMQITRDVMDSHMQHLFNLHDAQVRNFENLHRTYKAWREKDIQLQHAIEKGDSKQDSELSGQQDAPLSTSQQSVSTDWSAEIAKLQSELQYYIANDQQIQAIITAFQSLAKTRAETAKSHLSPSQQERVDKMMAHAKEVFGSLTRHQAEELRRKFHEIARHREK